MPALLCAALMAAGFARRDPAQYSDPFVYEQVHMGLPVRILLHAMDKRRADEAAAAAYARIAELDAMMSDYRPDSELNRLTAASGQWVPVSPDLLDVLTRALTMARDTNGAFDPTIGPVVQVWREARKTGKLPAAAVIEAAQARVGWKHIEVDRTRGTVRIGLDKMSLDLGGIAKGYILQQGLRALRMKGVGRALLEAGGDIVAGNSPPGRAGWRVDAPGADDAFAGRARELVNEALASSGATEQFVEIGGVRYSHIVDPRTGVGVTNAVLARVIARDAVIADALATALTILGPDAVPALSAKFPDVVISLTVK